KKALPGRLSAWAGREIGFHDKDRRARIALVRRISDVKAHEDTCLIVVRDFRVTRQNHRGSETALQRGTNPPGQREREIFFKRAGVSGACIDAAMPGV